MFLTINSEPTEIYRIDKRVFVEVKECCHQKYDLVERLTVIAVEKGIFQNFISLALCRYQTANMNSTNCPKCISYRIRGICELLFVS